MKNKVLARPSTHGYMYYFYDDYTYRCNRWIREDFTEWKIDDDGKVYIRHMDVMNWSYVSNSNSMFIKAAKEAQHIIQFNEQFDEDIDEVLSE